MLGVPGRGSLIWCLVLAKVFKMGICNGNQRPSTHCAWAQSRCDLNMMTGTKARPGMWS